MRAPSGYTYVVVLFLVAIASVVATRALENGGVSERRSREEQLLWVGVQFRNAIRSYQTHSPGTTPSWPPTLEALLDDNRTSRTRRHLRRIYRDPLTGNAQWGLVRNEAGQIVGIYSLATGTPLKTGGFTPELAAFADAKTYQDWKFVFQGQP
jgi:type II secretory pathway pseudopilin PulG